MLNILVTGAPRTGKTTLIKTVVGELGKRVVGFITEEIVKEGRRVGFNIRTFSGKESVLASVDNKQTRFYIGKYGVFLENLEKTVKVLEEEIERGGFDLIVVDEIGKMELCSEIFKKFITECLDHGRLFASIMLYDDTFTKKIKERKDTRVFTLTRGNWLNVKNMILKELQS